MGVESPHVGEAPNNPEQLKLQQYDGAVGRVLSGNLDLTTPLTSEQVDAMKTKASQPGNDLDERVKDKIEQAQEAERDKYYAGKSGDHLQEAAISIRDWVKSKKPSTNDEITKFKNSLNAIHLDVDLLTSDDQDKALKGLEQIKTSFYDRYGKKAGAGTSQRNTDNFINDVLNSCHSMPDFLQWMHDADEMLNIFTENGGNAVRLELYTLAQKKFTASELAKNLNRNLNEVNQPTHPSLQITLNGIEHGQWITTQELRELQASSVDTAMSVEKAENETQDTHTTDPVEITVLEIRKPTRKILPKLNPEQKRNLREILPIANLEAAEAFCLKLRSRLGQAIPTNEGVYTDTKTGISIHPRPGETVDSAWFNGTAFAEWANKHNLPLVILSKDLHARLLLKSPTIDNGQIKLLVYDPQRQNEIEEIVPLKMTFEEYKRLHFNQINEAVQSGRLHLRYDIDVHLYKSWLAEQIRNANTNTSLEVANIHGSIMLKEGTYDLSLQNDPELPREIISAKGQRFQYDEKNCVPLSFFAAILRFAATRNMTEIQTMIQNFQEGFGIRLLTRDELLDDSAA